MTKQELLELMRLLSALESWAFSTDKPPPDYLMDMIQSAVGELEKGNSEMRELRKLDPSTLKFGDWVLDEQKRRGRYVRHSPRARATVLLDDDRLEVLDTVFEPPLAWVEDQPVYAGDTLYTKKGEPFVVTAKSSMPDVLLSGAFGEGANIDELSWESPKVKHRVWLNLYPNGATQCCKRREEADELASSSRIECRLIEWEA